MARILYVTDLHGVIWKYKYIFEIVTSQKVDIVINGGDLLPLGNLLRQDEFIDTFLENYFSQFNDEKIYYISYLGNDDLAVFDPLFEKLCDKYSYITNIAQKKFDFNNYEFIGMNLVNDFPFALKDRARKDSENFTFPKQFGKPVLSTSNGFKKIDNWFTFASEIPTIEEELNQLIKPNNKENAIYIIHTPPSNLGLDVCHDGREVGSKAVYEFLKKNQPLLSFHGHIHESPDISGRWYSKLGRTICIQPGQGHHSQDHLIFVIIDLETIKIERFHAFKHNKNSIEKDQFNHSII
jgi:Icc-related predicted phosphoesterase